MARARLLDSSTGQFDEDMDDDDNSDQADPNVPPAALVEHARQLGDIDTKFDELLPQLQAIVSQDKQVLLFTSPGPPWRTCSAAWLP